MISGIRTVRAFAREPKAIDKHAAEIDRSYELARKLTIQSTIFSCITGLASFAGLMAVLWFGAKSTADGAITHGELISYMLYTAKVAMSVGVLGHLWTSLMRASGSAQRVFEILDGEAGIEQGGGTTLPAVRGTIEFASVRFEYPTRPEVSVLRDVSFRVEPSQVVALVGPSGSGKTTIANLLLRFYDPVAGRVSLDGNDLTNLDPHWLRGKVGIVSQEPILFSESILENIRYGRTTASDAEVRSAAKVANAHEFVTSFPRRI